MGADKAEPYWRRPLREASLLLGLFLAALLILIVRYSLVEDYDRDFMYFYSVGKLLNERPSAQLYDYRVQQEMSSEVHPMAFGSHGPSPYPPFVALAFRPLAKLPFMTAYHIWMLLGFGLYMIGLSLLCKTFLPGDRVGQSAACVCSLLFWPFLGKTLLNGQVAAIGFFSMSAALCAQYRGRFYFSGIALSICLYKPTLLLWLLPLLLVYRAWKTLFGFFGSAAMMFCITTAVLGFEVWRQYAVMTAGLGAWQKYLHQTDHVDIFGFIALASRSESHTLAWICFLTGAFLIVATWRYIWRSGVPNRIVLAWAFTIPASLVINFYSPIYDTILVIPSLISSFSLLGNAHPQRLILGSSSLLLASYLTNWIASDYRIQLFSLILTAVAVIQVRRFISATT